MGGGDEERTVRVRCACVRIDSPHTHAHNPIPDRRAIRVAMRDDLFIPDPKRSEKVNRFLKDLGSSLHVSWEWSPTGYGNLTKVRQLSGECQL